MYKFLNENPNNLYTGDCVIRAIATVLGKSWEDTFMDVALQGLYMGRMPDDNAVWGAYLYNKGFVKGGDCPNCYTVREFARDNDIGTYVIGTGTHAVALINGMYYDTWDSGDESVAYYWKEV